MISVSDALALHLRSWFKLSVLPMDPIVFHIENQCAHDERRERNERRNAVRRRSRSVKNRSLFPDLCVRANKIFVSEAATTIMPMDDRSFFDYDDEPDDNAMTPFTTHFEGNDDAVEPEDSASSVCATESTAEAEDTAKPSETRLHHYTNMSTHHYCTAFIELARKAHVSKSRTNDFLSFLRSGLPVPNRMPATDKHLLALLDVRELFTKRSVCLRCHDDFDYQRNTCPRCNCEERNSIAHVWVCFHYVAMYFHPWEGALCM